MISQAYDVVALLTHLSHCCHRVAREQSSVPCSLSACRIVGVATDMSIVALLYDIPCQSTNRQYHHAIGQWVETRTNMSRHAGVGVEFFVGLRLCALSGDFTLMYDIPCQSTGRWTDTSTLILLYQTCWRSCEILSRPTSTYF